MQKNYRMQYQNNPLMQRWHDEAREKFDQSVTAYRAIGKDPEASSKDVSAAKYAVIAAQHGASKVGWEVWLKDFRAEKRWAEAGKTQADWDAVVAKWGDKA